MKNKLYFVLMIMILMTGTQLFAESITLNFKDASIRQVFKIVCRQGGLSGVVHKNVFKKISINMVDTPAEDVIKAMAEDNGFALTKIGEVFFMYDPQSPVAYKYDKENRAKIDFTEDLIAENLKRMDGDADDITYSADIPGVDINKVFFDIASKAGKKYKVNAKCVAGRVSFYANNAPVADIFTAVALANGFEVNKDKDSWIVESLKEP